MIVDPLVRRAVEREVARIRGRADRQLAELGEARVPAWMTLETIRKTGGRRVTIAARRPTRCTRCPCDC